MGCGSSAAKNIPAQNTGSRFNIVTTLGQGASCSVHMVEDKATKERYALKVMNKFEAGKLSQQTKEMYDQEVDILKRLNHPNVLKMIDNYEDKQANTWNILTIMCSGGELFDRVKNGHFTEKVAAALTRQMLQAIAYCHENKIVHRDLKPENFVFETNADESPMKLIDFGCAKVAGDEDEIDDVAGSPYYVAPEVLRGASYKRTGATWKASDMWSVGIIVFLFVCGYPPFNGPSTSDIFRKIKRGKYAFPGPDDDVTLSEGAKDIITKLLQMTPSDRLSAKEALEHPWVKGDTASSTVYKQGVISGLHEFRNGCRLRKAVGRVLANRITDSDKNQLEDIFKKFDKNGDGRLNPDEIADMMRAIGRTEAETKEYIDQLDDDGDGNISKDEFAAGAMAAQLGKADSDEQKNAFALFDVDGDGFVSAEELANLSGVLPAQALKMIQEVDGNGDGKINFNEWLNAMKNVDRKAVSDTATQRTGTDTATQRTGTK